MKCRFKVWVDDNYHFMDVSHRRYVGTFENYDYAVRMCKSIVDDFLLKAYDPELTFEEYFKLYVTFGEDPFIVGSCDYPFSSWRYAETKCKEWSR